MCPTTYHKRQTLTPDFTGTFIWAKSGAWPPFLLYLNAILLWFSLNSLSLVPLLYNSEKSLAPSSLLFIIRHKYTMIWAPWAISSAGYQNPQLSQPFSSDRCCSPLIIGMALCWTCLLLVMSPKLDTKPKPASPEQSGGEKVTSLHLLVMLSQNVAQDTTRLLCHEGTCLVHGQVSSRFPKASSAQLLSSWWVPSLCWCMELHLPRQETWHFTLMNNMRLLLAHFSSLTRSNWQHKYWFHQSLSPSLYHLQACWMCTLSHYAD